MQCKGNQAWKYVTKAGHYISKTVTYNRCLSNCTAMLDIRLSCASNITRQRHQPPGNLASHKNTTVMEKSASTRVQRVDHGDSMPQQASLQTHIAHLYQTPHLHKKVCHAKRDSSITQTSYQCTPCLPLLTLSTQITSPTTYCF